MKKIFGCEDTIQCGFLKGVFENAGIPSLVRNEHLQGGAGEIPFVETWPELCVLEHEDAMPARRLVEDVLGTVNADARSWKCASCSETNGPQFSVCWKCGNDRYG